MAIRVLRMPMTKARRQLGSLVRGVNVEGDVVVLEKDGIPVAGLLDIDAVEDYLEAQDPALHRRLRASMKAYRSGRGRPAREFLDELKAEGIGRGGKRKACPARTRGRARRPRPTT